MNTTETKHTDHVTAFLNRDMVDSDTLAKAREDKAQLLAALQLCWLAKNELEAALSDDQIQSIFTAIRQATEKPEQNWIVTYNGEPIRRLKFEGTKANLIVGTVADAIRYSPEEAAEVAVAIGRGAEVIQATGATI